MGEAVKQEIVAKDAINAAFAYFKEFFEGARYQNLLLEGLEYLEGDNEWMVTIGFDVGRVKKTGSQLSFLQETKEPVRETRRFFLNANDCSFVRMD